MAKKGFFGFAVGTAAAAAGIWVTRKKGGLHFTVDVASPRLGESVADWKAKRGGAAETRTPGAGDDDGCGT